MKINLKYLFISLSLLVATNTFAQIGIGTDKPAASAALEITSNTNNKGILIPRITAAQKDAIVNPADGLMIFQTTAPSGFYYYSGSVWKLIAIQSDIESKVDKVTGKVLSTNDFTSAEKTKLAAITGTNTGDQDLSLYATNTALASKANTADVNTALDLKVNSADLNTSLATKVDKVVGKDLSTNDYTTAEKTKLAAITGTNTGDQTTITGNAGTATKLATARKINNVDFDGSADISIPIDAGALIGIVPVANGGTGASTITGIVKGNGTNSMAAAVPGTDYLAPANIIPQYRVTLGSDAGINTIGGYSVSIGRNANKLWNGSYNTAVGSFALETITAGAYNQAFGDFALQKRTSGGYATAIGAFALQELTTGSFNTSLGTFAGDIITIGSQNTLLGHDANPSANNSVNQTVIGYNAVGAGDNSVQLGNSNVTNVKTSGTLTAGSITYPNGSGTNGQVLTTNGIGTASWATLPGGLSAQWTSSNNDIYFSTGKVGIGLSNPGSMFSTNLDVAGRSSFRINSSNQALIMDGSSGFSRIYTDAASGTPDNLILGTYPNGHMKQLYLKQSNGYVGINNDNPSEQLDVLGSIKTTGKIKTGSITLPNTDGTSGQVLSTNGSGTVSWVTPASSSGSNFVDLTTDQTIAGSKTFSSDLKANGLTVGLGAGAQTSNTVIGNLAMANNSTGGYSVAIGLEALKSNTNGNSNTAIGHQALKSNTSGGGNIAIGMNVMLNNTIGQQNVAIGQSTLYGNTEASANTVIGYEAGSGITTGGYNTILGHESARGLTTGSGNTIIGRFVYTGNISNNIVLSNGSGEIKAQHNGTNWSLTGALSTTGNVTATGYVTSSDSRLKSNVVSLSSGLNNIMKLNPVHYLKKSSIESTNYDVEENGFIAQELQKVLPFVVKEGSDKNKLLSVNYTSIIPLLTKGIQEQQTMIETQQKQIEASNEKIEAQQKQLNEIKELLLKLTVERTPKN